MSKKEITASEIGRMGARITNTILTTESRREAAKKGWKIRKEKLLKNKQND